MSLSLCVAQLNPTVGDIQGNLAQAMAAAAQAHAQGCQAVVFAEMFLTGYAAGDLYAYARFLRDIAQAVQALQEASAQWPGLHIVIGHPQAMDAAAALAAHAPDGDDVQLPPCWNVVSVFAGGQCLAQWRKQALPNYGVFDEKRYFTSRAHTPPVPEPVVEIAGIRLGVLICADAWRPEAAARAQAAGAQVLLALSASPYGHGKHARRLAMAQARVRETGLPLLYVNLLGGQDELVFDGHSFAVDGDGQLACCAPAFEQALWSLTLRPSGPAGAPGKAAALRWQPVHAPATVAATAPVATAETAATAETTSAYALPSEFDCATTWQALVLALGDYVRKNGFSDVLLGLSGGLDSALVLALAVDALGPGRVRAVMMPSPYTASISVDDAREMVRRLGVRYDEISIRETFEGFKHSLAPVFAGRAEDTTEENLQARIRGVLLMAISNKFGALLLTTGNKSEVAMGYSTLYGDTCGGFAPLKDVFKSEAYALARWRNANAIGGVAQPIPERIITRAPSAELRENQTDQDSLPPYDMLDAIVRLRMEQGWDADRIIAAGFAPERVAQVLRLLRINEYKRQQGAPGPKLSACAFGRDWRYPITNRYLA